jgi:hypothetical protein
MFQPFLLRRTPVGLDAPVMYQGGSLNFGISPALHRAMAPTTSRRRRNIVELKGAGHFAWTDLRRTFHDPVVAPLATPPDRGNNPSMRYPVPRRSRGP